MEGLAYWCSLSDLALPIRTQLSYLIFDKALRRSHVTKDECEEDPCISSSEDESISAKEVTIPQSNQTIVNLVGVDTERVSYFIQFHFLVISGILRLVFFSVVLFKLLGLIPFTAGILAWSLTIPVNAWLSHRVLVESRTLMKARDAKLTKINEMLHGIRQIKFSALELQWKEKVLTLRDIELRSLWRFFLSDSGLFACWTISPILLSVVSLTAYVLVKGSLQPSTAFTSIGVLNTLETTLSSLPELVTLGLDGLVSLRRIGTFLDGPERPDIVADGPEIRFEKAIISWPRDAAAPPQNTYVLDGLDFTFPRGALSIVSGSTGSGKSLLLAAILGEASLLSGKVYRPKAHYSVQDNVLYEDWIKPGLVAYIAQSPWLENTSLRNNIVYGLPFSKQRYKKAIEACALDRDLASLTEGDETDLGEHGFNLSGGQKWRITLARAVYSQAEILVMEDIFSAVDTHVGSWILEKCLAGEICKGRTRILVTHHLDLVIPKASFVVHLGAGGVNYSGVPKKRRDNEPQQKVGSGEDGSFNQIVTACDDRLSPDLIASDRKSGDPKKVMQEEVREIGSVKRSVYLAYVSSSAGLSLWVTCLGIYIAYQAGTVGKSISLSTYSTI